jgi:hypothetical protein
MKGQHRERTTLDIFLLVLFVLATIGLVFDLAVGGTLRILASFFLFIGLGAVIRWRRFGSRRWRTVAWISFVLAFAALLFRLAAWTGWFGE